MFYKINNGSDDDDDASFLDGWAADLVRRGARVVQVSIFIPLFMITNSNILMKFMRSSINDVTALRGGPRGSRILSIYTIKCDGVGGIQK